MTYSRKPQLATATPSRACQSCDAPFTPRAPYTLDALGSVAIGAVCCVTCEAGKLAQQGLPIGTVSFHASN